LADAARPLPVDLIREPSWGDVLSDVGAGTSDATGDLRRSLEERGSRDRVDVAASMPL